jgi:hypothetical protein
MSIIRVGSSGQYAAGWEAVFGGQAKAAGAAKRSKKAAKAKAAKPVKKPAAKAKSRRG